MGHRLEAFKSLFTGKSYISGVPNAPTNYNQTTVQSFNDFFDWNHKGNMYKYINSYGNNPLVYMIINKIASVTSSIDIISVDEEGEEIESTSVIKELLLNPNDKQTYKDFIEEVYISLLTSGNAYVLHIAGIGAGNELKMLNPKEVELCLGRNGMLMFYKYTDSYGNEIRYEIDEVDHIRTSNVVNIGSTNVKLGMSPLQALWIIINASSEKFNASASIFKNRGIIGILTNKSDAPMLPKERKRLQDEFDGEVGGSDKFNKIKISTSDLSYIQTGMSPSDLKLLEGVMLDLRLLCAGFGMPSVLFNDNDSSTYNNVSEAKTTAYSDVYVPLGNKILDSLSAFLSERLGVTEKITLNVTSIEELRATTNRLLQTINSMPQQVAQRFIEVLTVDEFRALGDIGGISNQDLVSTLSKANENKVDEKGTSED